MQKQIMTSNKHGWIWQAGVYLLLLAAWQLLYWAGTELFSWWKPYAMPNPVGVFLRFTELLRDGTLMRAALYSFVRAVAGFLMAVAIGIVAGGLIGSFELLGRSLRPLILGIQSLPSICWVPFAILWFGLNENAILFVVVMGSAFSIATAVESGIRNVNPLYIKVAKTMGAGKRDLFLRVVFPAGIPAFLSGLRQGWSFAWRALMSAEVMSASVGLGYTLMLGRDLADINQVMLVMLAIVLIGILVDKLVFSYIERRVLEKRGLLQRAK